MFHWKKNPVFSVQVLWNWRTKQLEESFRWPITVIMLSKTSSYMFSWWWIGLSKWMQTKFSRFFAEQFIHFSTCRLWSWTNSSRGVPKFLTLKNFYFAFYFHFKIDPLNWKSSSVTCIEKLLFPDVSTLIFPCKVSTLVEKKVWLTVT